MGFLSKILSAGEGRQLKKYWRVVDEINEVWNRKYKDISLEELKEKFDELKQSYADGKLNEHELRVEGFALAKEIGYQRLGLLAHDVQLIAGLCLLDGHVAEEQTGEGKTFVSHIVCVPEAIMNEQVHIVTVNEYLAKRDAEEAVVMLSPLGVTVGLIYNQQRNDDKKLAYKCNIVYGTPSEFGFDYLRDNMVMRKEQKVQRGHSFAIVDEADSILIDEARTPLIISGPGMDTNETYMRFAAVMPQLKEGKDFIKDEKKRQINATEEGLEKVERLLGIDNLYDDPSGQLPNHLMQGLKAQFLFHRDKDYIIEDGEVKIVDEFTGRVMEGRRWSEGLHQAIEAKEHVMIKEENQTIATITLQNYFRLYDKLSGMTGTAITEDAEFRKTYNMGVVVVPPNKPCIREDKHDLVYRTEAAKYNAIADEIEARHEIGQPVLVGTISVENSEKLSRLLSKRGIKHNVLNAKNHEREAAIVAQAGRQGAVTIATNMAGRGTDIILGGNVAGMEKAILADKMELDAFGEPIEPTEEEKEEAHRQAQEIHDRENKVVLEAGGLAVIGSERHDARRIDNQLRGRSGRQGDPGSSQFYLSLEDELMRLFGGERLASVSNMLVNANVPDDVPIQASLVSKAIETAQRQVESMNFEMRKNVLEYDDVMNRQRLAIYGERNEILEGTSMDERAEELLEKTVWDRVEDYLPDDLPYDDWDWEGIRNWYEELTGENLDGEVTEFVDITEQAFKNNTDDNVDIDGNKEQDEESTEEDEIIEAEFEEVKDETENGEDEPEPEYAEDEDEDEDEDSENGDEIENTDNRTEKKDSIQKVIEARMVPHPLREILQEHRVDGNEEIGDAIEARIKNLYEQKKILLGEEGIESLERQIMLRVIDTNWMRHLSEMDYLKSGIGLRSFAQRDPLTEYKNEAYAAFQELIATMYKDWLRTLLRLQVAIPTPQQEEPMQNMSYQRPHSPTGSITRTLQRTQQQNSGGSVGKVNIGTAELVTTTAVSAEPQQQDPSKLVGITAGGSGLSMTDENAPATSGYRKPKNNIAGAHVTAKAGGNGQMTKGQMNSNRPPKSSRPKKKGKRKR